MDRHAARFLVNGRVQGVGYRYFVLREAGALRIDGHVRNLADGSVEVVAEAAPETLRVFADRLAEGPAFSEVTSIDRTTIPASHVTGFRIC
jgi:acylphosphatase